MQLRWTKHLKTKEEVDDFHKLLRSSTLLLTRLKGILEEKYFSSLKQEESYDFSGDWANKAAFEAGYRSALSDIKNLIDLKEK